VQQIIAQRRSCLSAKVEPIFRQLLLARGSHHPQFLKESFVALELAIEEEVLFLQGCHLLLLNTFRRLRQGLEAAEGDPSRAA